MMKFYVLKTTFRIDCGSGGTIYSDAEPAEFGAAPACESCGAPVGKPVWLAPRLAIVESWGEKFDDVAYGPGGGLLVSENFRGLYERAGLKGLRSFEPAEVVSASYARSSREIVENPAYYFAAPAPAKVLLDAEASGLETQEPAACPDCLAGRILRFRRVAIVESTYDGDDIFHVRGLPGLILASERFRELGEQNPLSNLEFIPAEEYGEDFNV